MTEQEKRELIERYLQAYNCFDIEAMMSTLHENVVFENISAGEVTTSAQGCVAFRQLAEQAKDLFSARKQSVKTWRFAAEEVTVEIDYEGIVATDLPNGMKTGEVLRLAGTSEFWFKNGLISQIVDRS